MKRILIFNITILIFNLRLLCQFSISGHIAMPYSADSLIPLSGMDVRLIEKNILLTTNKNGFYIFDGLDTGLYSLEISGFNKIIIKNIEIRNKILLDTIQMILDYGSSPSGFIHSIMTAEDIKSWYANIGTLVRDTLTNNLYDQGIYISGETLPDSTDPNWKYYIWEGDNLYRQGEWNWKGDSINIIENYDNGRLNGQRTIYNNEKIIVIGNYKNNIKNGIWKFFNNNGDLFETEFRNGYLVIDLKVYPIKYYNSRIQEIYKCY
jgi:hypothetical protein